MLIIRCQGEERSDLTAINFKSKNHYQYFLFPAENFHFFML